MNIANLPFRNCTAELLMKWWKGPEWFKQCSEDWPQVEEHPDTEVINSEKRKTIVSALNVEDEAVSYFHRISSYKKLIRVGCIMDAYACRISFQILEKFKIKIRRKKIN